MCVEQGGGSKATHTPRQAFMEKFLPLLKSVFKATNMTERWSRRPSAARGSHCPCPGCLALQGCQKQAAPTGSGRAGQRRPETAATSFLSILYKMCKTGQAGLN